MAHFTRTFDAINAANHAEVGGKGANLGELTQAGFNVPPGFCVTTEAFRRFMADAPTDIYPQLEQITLDDLEQLRRVGHEVRASLERVPLPQEVTESVVRAWRQTGETYAYAVRSSATAEDLPFASFAGQHDTYLNIRGADALLKSVKACFISLFTDRAILYRLQNGFDHRRIALAVVIQQMVQADVSGVLFTADPVSGNRNIASIDASFGLGEAIVSGLVSADLYRVDKRTHRILKRQVATKRVAIRALDAGGTQQITLPAGERTRAALTDTQIGELARLGSQIEAHYGKPQDIEWAIAADTVYIIQARPITSLYPLPMPRPEDDALHVYFSISHQQVMTDSMPPLSLSILRTFLPVGHDHGQMESRYVATAGGRIYGDVSPLLRHPLGRRFLCQSLMRIEPRSVPALSAVAARPRFQTQGERLNLWSVLRLGLPFSLKVLRSLLWDKTETATEKAMTLIEEHLTTVRSKLKETQDLQARLNFTVYELHHMLTPAFKWTDEIIAGFIASGLLNVLMRRRVDGQDLLAQERGLIGGIETEMELAVGDLADAARASEELLTHLEQTHLDVQTRLARAVELPGSETFLQAWDHFMEVYGARGPSEIDLSRPRWLEDPTSLLQMVLSAASSSEPGTHRARYRRLITEAEQAAARITEAAGRGFLGWIRRPLVRRFIHASRGFIPLRGYHKYLAVRVLSLLKPVFGEAGEALRREGRLEAADDIWFLTLPEILNAWNDKQTLKPLVAERRSAFEHYQTLTPPHVITSEGEIPAAQLAGGNAPDSALIGSPVSAGVVEGIAKVVLDPRTARLNPGEILVAPFTDPGWTPLFVNAAGLITEVGGLMSHGSVVAREYGIPAVVGVIDATKRIRSGQRVRVHGDAGYVELLDGSG